MNKVIDKGFRSCRFVSTIVKHPVLYIQWPQVMEAVLKHLRCGHCVCSFFSAM